MLKDSLKISKFKSNKHKYLQLKNKHKICISVGTNHKGLAVQQKFLSKLKKNSLISESNVNENFINLFKDKTISYSTYMYILNKVYGYKFNLDNDDLLKLFTEWSIESGIYSKERFFLHF